MKRLLFYPILFFCMICSLRGQPARDSVIDAVNCVFKGMKNADTVLLKSCFSPNAVLQTIQEDHGSTIKVREEKLTDFVDFVGKETIGAADEQITVETVKIDGPLAFVWTPYKFYYRGNSAIAV